MLFKYWVVCLLLFTLLIQATASSFMPAVTNYLAKDYEAGYQNWACAQGSNGEMFFGNSQGLLVYDGYRWTLHKVPGNHIVRSVYVKEDRIYVGAFEEFGYFKYSEAGTLRYHSLSKFLKNFPMENNEIWNIVELDGRIYFQSFSAWFSYDGKMVRAFRNRQQQPLYFYNQNGHIYTQMIDEGFYEFDGKEFHHLFPRSKVNDDNVVALLPDGNNSFLMVTENNGLFRYTGDITPWKTDIDAELKKQRVNRAVMTNDSIFMIGTVLNGIYAIDRKGHCLWHFNLDNRLDNNTVLGLFCDKDNNVWAALDDGIAYIHHNSPVMLLTPANHETKLGMVYDIAHRGDCFYLAVSDKLIILWEDVLQNKKMYQFHEKLIILAFDEIYKNMNQNESEKAKFFYIESKKLQIRVSFMEHHYLKGMKDFFSGLFSDFGTSIFKIISQVVLIVVGVFPWIFMRLNRGLTYQNAIINSINNFLGIEYISYTNKYLYFVGIVEILYSYFILVVISTYVINSVVRDMN